MMGPKKVSNACQRCKKQKLKCDIQRPCTLCSRAGVQCVAIQTNDIWREHRPANSRRSTRRIPRKNISEPSSTRLLVRDATKDLRPGNSDALSTADAKDSLPLPTNNWNSSSAASYIMEAFRHHDAVTPEESTPNFLKQSARREHHSQGLQANTTQLPSVRQRSWYSRAPSSFDAQLISLLPRIEVAAELIEIYFNRIHWFTLVFHQTEFRRNFQKFYEDQDSFYKDNNNRSGYVMVLLAVFALSLEYATEETNRRLDDYNVDIQRLQDKILAALRANLLDIVSMRSIEAVQTCVLLGSYYLYHGDPERAWPICGCGLRVAQALNLHRRLETVDGPGRMSEETRKRCWWAVYEMETFCSMLYGFPLGITDSDCDIDLLDPYDRLSSAVSRQSAPAATMLSFKRCMSQLSVIVKSALAHLYSRQPDSSPKPSARLRQLLQKVEELDTALEDLYTGFPERLRVSDTRQPTFQHTAESVQVETTDTDFAAQSESRIYLIQALALRLAFENAKILIHRPLLSFKGVGSPSKSAISKRFELSVRACRDAALQISNLGSTPGFTQTTDTYAVAFVSVHLLTAGITLCIMTSIAPLSSESQECKLAIRRLMEMQAFLKRKSVVAEQGYEVMTKLVRLVMEKETKTILDHNIPTNQACINIDTGNSVTSALGAGYRREQEMISSTELNEIQPSQSPAASANNVRFADNDSSLQGPMISGVDTLSDFQEDFVFTQTLLDFGLVNNGEGMLPFMDRAYALNDFSVTQDQGWIWDLNHCL